MSAPDLPAWIPSRFRPLRLLGEGGFGRVVLCRDEELDRDAAVKVLHDQLADPELRARFVREAQVTARFEHPAIVRVFDSSVDDEGRAYIVYEFVPGESLAQRFSSGAPVELDEAVRWARELAEALHLLHQQGVVHRDIKPENILLRDDGGPVLCDLGIALPEAEDRLTQEGLILGTPGYLAPEVWSGERPGPSSDQFALAATLHRLVYRRSVYPADDPVKVIEFLRSGEPIQPGEPRSPEETKLNAALARALRRRAADRFPDLAAFAAALDAVTPRGIAEPGRTVQLEIAGAEPAGATQRIRPPAETPARPWKGRAAGVVGLLLLAWLGWRPGAPPRPTPAPTPSAPPPASPADPLEELLRGMGYPGEAHPELGLELVLIGRLARDRPGIREQAAAGLLELPLTPRVAYLRLLHLEQVMDRHDAGSPERLAAYRDAVELAGKVVGGELDYFRARVRVQLLWMEMIRDVTHRSRPVTDADFPERLEALLRELDASPDLELRLVRALLWERLARGLGGRATKLLLAWEVARVELEELLRRREELQASRRLALVLLALRVTTRLGEEARFDAVHRSLADWALRAVEDPGLRNSWRRRLFRDSMGSRHINTATTTGQWAMGHFIGHDPYDPGVLPLPPGWPGAGMAPGRAPIVKPRRPDPMIVTDGGAGARPLADQIREALLLGRPLRANRARLEAMLRRRLRRGKELPRQLLDFPGLLLQFEALLEGEEEQSAWLEDLEQTEQRLVGAERFRELRRCWFAGDWARLRMRLLAEARTRESGKLFEKLLRRYGAHGLAKLRPPWTLDEAEFAYRLWQQVLLQVRGVGVEPVVRREALRLGLRWLEARRDLGGAGPGSEELAELEALLGPYPEPRGELPAGYPQPGKILPESAFGPTPIDPAVRIDALRGS